MTMADTNHIPNSGNTPQPGATASQEGNEAPPLTLAAIGQALHAAQAARNAADRAALDAEKGSKEHRRHHRAMGVLQDRHNALCALAMTMRPASMEDAAVQIGAAIDAANDLVAFDISQSEVEERAGAILRALLGVLPIVARAAELDLATFCWVSLETLSASLCAGMAA